MVCIWNGFTLKWFIFNGTGVWFCDLCVQQNVTGLVKAKKYDWKDSNLALFGSDTEKEVKSKYRKDRPLEIMIVLYAVSFMFEGVSSLIRRGTIQEKF